MLFYTNFLYKREVTMNILEQIPKEKIPNHIAIIMDGNGRWAKQRMLPRKMGHREGARTLNKIIDYADKIGLKYITVYAFSTENWKRPKDEVESLMKLLKQYVDNIEEMSNKNYRLIVLGDIAPLSEELQKSIIEIEEKSKDNTGITVNIAFNYGSRDEIVRASKNIAKMYKSGEIELEDIDEELFSANLYTHGQPDPDFIIRPSGEQRLSNFLMWQASYSELIFSNKLWPDFTPKDLDDAIIEFVHRDRRFGGV